MSGKIDATVTLAELVDHHPELARQFERRGLDYCCGGRHTLDEACARAGLPLEVTLAELDAAVTPAAPADWMHMSAVELVDHIEVLHHRAAWEELPRLSALLDRVVSVHGRNHPELHDIAARFAVLRADLEPHMLKEERVLFPMIRQLAGPDAPPAFHCGTLRHPISVMLLEHAAVGQLLQQLRAMTDDYRTPPDACASYAACFRALAELEADTHLHVHKENNVLFPMVVRMEEELARTAR
jgi:regulator of cell morphogenesis and NO signaling